VKPSDLLSTVDIITHLFVRIDDTLPFLEKRPNSHLYVSEIVTIGCLFALRSGTFSSFYRWLKRDYLGLFPKLPERSRLQRLIEKYAYMCVDFLAKPSVFCTIDSYPIETIRPIRQGRSEQQLGRKSKDKGRWSVGIKYCPVLNDTGHIVNFGWTAMNQHDQVFNGLSKNLEGESIVLADLGFRSAQGVPENMKICKKGTWNGRMYIETVFSMCTYIFLLKQIYHRVGAYITARLAYVSSVFNILLDLHRTVYNVPDSEKFKMSIKMFDI
jgi:hypothetical protein